MTTAIPWLLTMLMLVLCVILDRKWTQARRRVLQLERELDELSERLFGSRDNYERAKHNHNVTRITREREFKVAAQCADKGIPRTNKQYPSRFKGTR